MIQPGGTLGLLGGGQLGQMFTQAARRMGYAVILLAPEPDCPAASYASEHIRADYLDKAALEQLGQRCDAVTTEFENVPAEALRQLASHCLVRPGPQAVWLTQDRIREKTFLRQNHINTAPFAVVGSRAELAAAVQQVALPALLKTSQMGYDGKGQFPVNKPEDALAAWQLAQEAPCVLESRVVLDTELSVVLARDADGNTSCFPVAENLHRHGILDLSIVPARVSPALSDQAVVLAQRIAGLLEYVGVMAVEFFVSQGELLVNEIAPRPHNSGHYTLDACTSSQFEQQVRSLCGLPLAPSRQHTPAVMANLLGDLWPGETTMPDWTPVLTQPGVHLHLYGKRQARPGRKMGHFTVLDADPARALARALELRQAFQPANNTQDPGSQPELPRHATKPA